MVALAPAGGGGVQAGRVVRLFHFRFAPAVGPSSTTAVGPAPERVFLGSGAAFVVAIGDVRLGVGAVAALAARAARPTRADAVGPGPRGRGEGLAPHLGDALLQERGGAVHAGGEDAALPPRRRKRRRALGNQEHHAAERRVLRCDAHRVAHRLRRQVRGLFSQIRRVLVALGPVKPPAAARALLPGDPEQARATHGAVTLLPQRVQRLQRALDAPHRLLARGVSLGGGQRRRALRIEFLHHQRVEDALVHLDSPGPGRGLAHAAGAVVELARGGGGGGGRRRRLAEQLGQPLGDAVRAEQRALVHHEQHARREHLQGLAPRVELPFLLQAQLEVPQAERELHRAPS